MSLSEGQPPGRIEVDMNVETAVRGKCSLVGRETAFPGYIAEIKGAEDWGVLLRYHHLRYEKWPVMLPSGRWESLIRSFPKALTTFEPTLRDLIRTHHFIFYDPPELYNYLMPVTLITHALRGNRSQARLFWKEAIEAQDKEAALKRLADLERPFVRAEWDHAVWHKYQQPRRKSWDRQLPPSKPEALPRLEQVWSVIDREYLHHLQDSMEEASILPSASFIPPVPLLRAHSSETQRLQVVRMNRASAFLSRSRYEMIEGAPSAPNMAWPWFSIYVDASCLGPGGRKSSATGVKEVSEIIQTSFDTRAHVGIALTLSRWSSAKRDRVAKDRLVHLIEGVHDFANSRGVPVLLPRSGYYGLEMLDYGVPFFSSLLSGAPRYPSKPGMPRSEEGIYGKVSIYRSGDLSLREVKTYLRANGELPRIQGLPGRPSPGMYGDPRAYRIRFSKPRRLGTHSRELNEIAKAIGKGTRRPALRYLEDMSAMGKRYH